MEEPQNVQVSTSSKLLSKSQALYNFLLKKKKVGPQKCENADGGQLPKSDDSSLSGEAEISELISKDRTPDSRSDTNSAFCCSGIDSCDNPCVPLMGKDKPTDSSNFEQTDEEPEPKNSRSPTSRLHGLMKISSENNLMSRFNATKNKLTARKGRPQKRSISLSRGVFPTSDRESNFSDGGVGVDSSECSPKDSPAPTRASIRRRLFFSQERKSVDVPSSAGSSPASVRSLRTGKRRGRPFSVAIMDGGNSLANSRTASADSLALQSLLAAQVLHLIPVAKARQRNFLHGRIATNSLLGNIELTKVLPMKEVSIFVCTWNMNGEAPPGNLNLLLLPEELSHIADIVAIGTQESWPEKNSWEISLQETLGPSHVLLHSASLGTLHLAIFLRRDLIWFASLGDESSYSVRPGTAFRTKGAVGIAFYLFGTTFLFVTCHLTAHQDKMKERISDIRRIVRSLDLPKVLPCRQKAKDVTENFDHVLWFGDLNFRVSGPREDVLQWLSRQSFPVEECGEILANDQLTSIISEGNVLKGFREGNVSFPPTYKFDVGSQQYDSSTKQRTPSYTDRILYKSRREECSLECLQYTSVKDICTSDHKPVWALLKTSIRPGIDTIPLAAGLFNREVYIEAIKRRAAAMDYRQDVSTICSLQ